MKTLNNCIVPAAVAVLGVGLLPVWGQRQAEPDAQTLVAQCQGSGLAISAADCAKWAARRQTIVRAACPDSHAGSACRSFKELLRASDPDMMKDLSRQDHVYICFLPSRDEFFKFTYSLPSQADFSPASAKQIKEGVPAAALAAQGVSNFSYYSGGVVEPDSSVRDEGNWIYSPGAATDPETARMNLNVHQAWFKGRHVQIDADEWKLAETYDDDAGTPITHTVAVQLATGRFRQQYALAESGEVKASNAGRCLIAPAEGH